MLCEIANFKGFNHDYDKDSLTYKTKGDAQHAPKDRSLNFDLLPGQAHHLWDIEILKFFATMNMRPPRSSTIEWP